MGHLLEGLIKFVKETKLILFFIAIAILISMVFESCNQKETTTVKKLHTDTIAASVPVNIAIPLDSALIPSFFESYPKLKKYENELIHIYRDHDFNYIWFDQKGIVEYGSSLYSKVKNIQSEGVSTVFPYQENIDDIFEKDIKDVREHPEAEILLTGFYLFYFNEVFAGIDPKTTADIGWLLPRKKLIYSVLLDSIISDKKLQFEDSLYMFRQYFRLRDALKRYRDIEKNGGWNPIDFEAGHITYKPTDTSEVILQIRDRLYTTGEVEQNNLSNVYDDELLVGIKRFQEHNGLKPDSLISAEDIAALNRPVDEYIKTIVVNMERCRWVPPKVSTTEEFIFVNIPAYSLSLYREGKIELKSPVVVGKIMTKTVIFDGEMTYIVFSPYWNLPQSIINNEVIPGMEKDKDYLKNRNMEWNNGQVRQRPGRNNSLGLVKFIFPNSNAIYLHDTPAKNLFKREDRAMSHGCIRVAKAKELAIEILKDDKDWPVERIDAAMHAGKETICTLKNEIPVYIGYFTAWVDQQGQINFYKDVYDRDDRLAALLFYK